MDRLARSDSNATKNFKSRLPIKRIGQNSLSRQPSMMSQTNLYMQKNEEITDEEEADGEPPKFDMPDMQENYSNRGADLCGICNLTVGRPGPGGNAVGFEKPFSCGQGHLLCQRCVQRLDINTNGCILCGNEHSSRSSSECSLDNYPEPSEINNQPDTPWKGSTYFEARQSVPSFRANYIENIDRPDLSGWETNRTNDDIQRNYCNLSKMENVRTDSELKINGQMNVECSRRPIRCPRLDCAVNIAFSALTHHFLFDHPEVPIISVEPGAKSTLIVSFSGLSCDSSRCLAVLLVSGKLSNSAARLFNGSPIHPKYRNRLPLPVLAARLHCANRYDGGEGHGQGDIIIAWVAGLDIACVGALRCSIQAVDSIDGDGIRSLTYTGPINSLRTAQRPREVFHTGDCVILHEGLLTQLTSDCATLNVNVIVH